MEATRSLVESVHSSPYMAVVAVAGAQEEEQLRDLLVQATGQ